MATLSTAYPPREVKEIRFKRGIIGFTGSLNFKGTVLEQLTLPKMLRYLFQQIRNILYKQVNRYQKSAAKIWKLKTENILCFII